MEGFTEKFHWMGVLSRSYAYRLEGSTTGKWGVGGHIEFESDITIEKDPRLNFTLYGEYNPLSFVELAFGGWAEILRLGKEPLVLRQVPNDGYKSLDLGSP